MLACLLACNRFTARQLLASHRMLHITSRNRNTKSEFGAVEAMRVLMRGGTRVWCLCLNNETSTRGGGQQETKRRHRRNLEQDRTRWNHPVENPTLE